MKMADFSEDAPVMMLKLTDGEVYAGNAVDKFVESKPFEFQGL
jgi:hypothetical protein